jgi:hypothetical protein
VRVLKQIVGWLLVIPSVPFVIMSLHDLWWGDGKTGADILVGLAAFFGLVSAVGVKLILAGRAGGAPDGGGLAGREAAALRRAAAARGTLGPAELAAQGGMSFAEARGVLDGLSRQGACEVVVTENGAVLYRFHDLQARGEGPVRDVLE